MHRGNMRWVMMCIFFVLLGIAALSFGIAMGRGNQWKAWIKARANIIAWVLIVLGIFIRIAWSQFSGAEQTSDFSLYATMAEEVYRGDYFLTPRKQSGPALVGAFIYWLSNGIHISYVLLFQAIISGLTLPLVYFSVKKLLGELSGIFALFLIAFNPEAWMYNNLFGNEPYIGFLITLSWTLIAIGDDRSKYQLINYLLSGSFLALAQYMRGTALIIFSGFLFFLIVYKINYKNLCAFVVGFVIFISPIAYFNYDKLGLKTLAISQYSGVSLYIGSNLKSNGDYYPEFSQELDDEVLVRQRNGVLDYYGEIEALKVKSSLSAVELDSVIKNRIAEEMALKRISANKFELIKLGIITKLPTFWAGISGFSWSLETAYISKYYINIQSDIEWLASIFHYLCLLLGSFGLILLVIYGTQERLRAISLFAFSGLLIGFLHMFVEVQGKYHYSIITIFPIVGSIFLAYLDEIRLSLLALIKK